MLNTAITRSRFLELAGIAALGLGAASLAPCGVARAEGDTVPFTDSCGREVQIPAQITMVAPSGPLAQQVLLNFDPAKLCGLATELTEKQASIYGIDMADYTVFGQIYGGKGNLNKEAVAAAGTQIVIDLGEAKETIVEDMDNLQEALGIPCIHIETGIAIYGEAYRTLGQILGEPERGEELGAYCEDAYAQTRAVVDTISPDDYFTVAYLTDETHAIAAGSFHGQAIEACSVNAVVVDDVVGNGYGNEISIEQLAVWDPEVIITCDKELFDKVWDDPVWSTLSAVRNGEVYIVPTDPYNWITNPPSVNQVMGWQWLPRLLYPTAFEDDIRDVINAYYVTMYGYELDDETFVELCGDSLPAGYLEQ